MIEFQVSTRHTDHKRRIKVMVYDSIPEMHRAQRKRDGFVGKQQDPGWYTRMAACTNCAEWQKADGEPWIPMVTIRLVRGKMTPGMVAHESTHAAWYLYQKDVQKTVPDMKREEVLCYLVGHIFEQINSKLRQKGLL